MVELYIKDRVKNVVKEIQKSDKKSSYIPYLDNIETTSIGKMLIKPEFMGVLVVLKVEQIVECIWLNLRYGRMLSGVKQQERLEVSLEENPLERIIIDYK